MKRQISGILIILCVTIINFACVRQTIVVAQPKKDNGKHKGWYKNPKNPHHPAHARSTGGGNNTTVIINNSNNKGQANYAKSGNGNAHGNSKGNASKGHGGGNGKGKGKK